MPPKARFGEPDANSDLSSDSQRVSKSVRFQSDERTQISCHSSFWTLHKSELVVCTLCAAAFFHEDDMSTSLFPVTISKNDDPHIAGPTVQNGLQSFAPSRPRFAPKALQ
jgi:hypothetical protein